VFYLCCNRFSVNRDLYKTFFWKPSLATTCSKVSFISYCPDKQTHRTDCSTSSTKVVDRCAMLAIFSLKSGLIIRTHRTHGIRCEPTFRGLSAPGKGHFLGRGDILGYAQAYSRSTYSKLFAWGQRIAMRPLANIDVATRSNYYSRLSYLEANVGVSAGCFTCTDRPAKTKELTISAGATTTESPSERSTSEPYADSSGDR